MNRWTRALGASLLVVAAAVPISNLRAAEPDVAPAAEERYVGILYADWFNQLCHGDAATCPPTYPEPIGNGYRYWGEPAGGKYVSDDVAVINRHADQLSAAGIDFITFDYSNHNAQVPVLDDPTGVVLETFKARVAAGKPTPKVSFLVSRDQDDIQKVTDRWLEPYRDLWMHYQGKPLLNVSPSDCDPSWAVCDNYTHKGMWAFDQPADTWTFMQQYPQTAAMGPDGRPEQVSVSAAQQTSYMSNTETARGRNFNHRTGRNDGYDGQNFDDQWERAISLDPTFVFVRGWNEWAAIQLADPSIENGRYTDLYNDEFSNDIEPQEGGLGDRYYQSMKAHIARYKGSDVAPPPEEPPPPPPDTTPPPPDGGGTARPIAAPGGKCVDVHGIDDGGNGAAVQLWDCLDGAPDHQWAPGPNGSLRTLGRCMDVEGNITDSGTPVHLWDCNGVGGQEWEPRPDGTLRNPQSGRCLDATNGDTGNGTRLRLGDCNGSGAQQFRLSGSTTPPPTDDPTPPPTDDPTPPPPPTGDFGNTTIHPEKLGIYAIPDMHYDDMGTVEASFAKIHALLPNAYLRWDNETGHHRNTPAMVEDYISRANNAGLPMIIAACCVDGYDNWWARGGQQPTVSIGQIADGPYLSFADRMRRTYPNVKYVETINEPDTIWFVSNPDDEGDWNRYMDKLYAASGGETSHLMGPSAAFPGSKIWNNTAARSEIQQFSYHTYGGWSSLTDAAGKDGTWVTEYGDDRVPNTIGNSPGYVLADLWNAERNSKLSGNIKQLSYVDLQSMMPADAKENGHYAFSGRLRGLAAYQALGNISTRVHTDPDAGDFMAADDGRGGFGALVFNSSADNGLSGSRTVPGTSVAAGTPLYVLTIRNESTGSATCQPLADQGAVGVDITSGQVSLNLNGVPPLSAAFVSTNPCTDLAN